MVAETSSRAKPLRPSKRRTNGTGIDPIARLACATGRLVERRRHLLQKIAADEHPLRASTGQSPERVSHVVGLRLPSPLRSELADLEMQIARLVSPLEDLLPP